MVGVLYRRGEEAEELANYRIKHWLQDCAEEEIFAPDQSKLWPPQIPASSIKLSGIPTTSWLATHPTIKNDDRQSYTDKSYVFL